MPRLKTTSRHKADNTFKFQSFSQKLSSISLEINSNFRDELSEGRLLEERIEDLGRDEQETFLSRTIEKWSQLNLTAGFESLLKELGREIVTLPQILHHKNTIVPIVLRYVSGDEKFRGGFEPTIQIAIALCLDLQKEFWPWIPQFIEAIIRVLEVSRDPEVLAIGFRGMSYLLKYGRVHVLRNFSTYFLLLLPLLKLQSAGSKGYLRIFGAQAMESVITILWKRKRKELFQWLRDELLKKYPEIQRGLSSLLFSMLKGVQRQLKINAVPEFQDCLDCLSPTSEPWIQTLSLLLQEITFGIELGDYKKIMDCLWNPILESNASKFPAHLTLISNSISYISQMPAPPKISAQFLQYHVENLVKLNLDKISSQLDTKTLATISTHLLQHPNLESNPRLTQFFLTLVKLGSADTKELEKGRLQRSDFLNTFLLPLCKSSGDDGNTYYRLVSSKLLLDGLSQNFGRNLVRIPISSEIKSLNCCKIMESLETTAESIDFQELTQFVLVTFHTNWIHQQEKICACLSESRLDNLIEKYLESQNQSNNTKLLFLLLQGRLLAHNSTHPLGIKNKDLISKVIDFLIKSLKFNSFGTFCPRATWTLKILDTCLQLQIQKIPLGIGLEELEIILLPWLRSGYSVQRALALSILLHASALSKEPTGGRIAEEALKSAIQIESLDTQTLDPTYLSTVNMELERLLQLAEYSDSSQLFINNYVLGLLFKNYSPLWPSCVGIIKKVLLRGAEGQGLRYLPYVMAQLDLADSPDNQILESMAKDPESEIQETNFFAQYEAEIFNISKTARQESLNFKTYRKNLWAALVGLDDQNGKNQDLKTLVSKAQILLQSLVQPPPYTGLKIGEDHGPCIEPILDFLTHCPSIRNSVQQASRSTSPALPTLLLNFLLAENEAVRKKTLSTLSTLYKFLPNYSDELMSLVGNRHSGGSKGRKSSSSSSSSTDLTQFSPESPNPLIKISKHRSIVMSIVVRLLVSKFQSATTSVRSSIIQNVMIFSEDEIRDFINLILGQWLDWPDSIDIQVGNIEKRLHYAEDFLRALKYKFPNLTKYCLQLICSMISLVNKKENEISQPQDTTSPAHKSKSPQITTLALGSLMVLFTNLSQLTTTFEPDIIHQLFTTILGPKFETLAQNSTASSIPTLLKLLSSWSQLPRFHGLLIYKLPQGESGESIAMATTPMEHLVNLLNSGSVSPTIKLHVITEIFGNLAAQQPESDEPMETEEFLSGLESNTIPLEIPSANLYQFPTKFPTSLEILLFAKTHLISPTIPQSMLRQSWEIYLNILKCIVPHVESPEALQIAKILLGNSPRKIPSQHLPALFNICNEIVLKIPGQQSSSSILEKLTEFFVTTQERQLRAQLVQIYVNAGTGATGLMPEILEIISDMNSWDEERDLESPDWVRRDRAVRKILEILSNSSETAETGTFNYLQWQLIVYNSYFWIQGADSNQTVLASNVIQILTPFFVYLGKFNPLATPEISRFIEQVLLRPIQRFAFGFDMPKKGKAKEKAKMVQNSSGAGAVAYENWLHILQLLIEACAGAHGTLRDLGFLVERDEATGESMLEGLRDIQTNGKTRAMNRLLKHLESLLTPSTWNVLGGSVLRSYILPLATYFLRVPKLGRNPALDNLLDVCTQVVRATVRLLPPKAFAELLNNVLDSQPKETALQKRYKRYLLAVMGGFNYDYNKQTSSDASIASGKLEVAENCATKDTVHNIQYSSPKTTDPNEHIPNSTAPEFSDSPNKLSDSGDNSAEDSSNCTTRNFTASDIESLDKTFSPVLLRLSKFLKFKDIVSHKKSGGLKTEESAANDDPSLILHVEATVGLVQLLQKLPPTYSRSKLVPIIPTLCSYLKSKDHGRRRLGRSSLLQVLRELGPSSFPQIVRYLEANLKVGYQLHVLNFTLSQLLTHNEQSFAGAGANHNIPTQNLVAHCAKELFGVMSDEKTIGKIVEKTFEARGNNTEHILRICAKFANDIGTIKKMVDMGLEQIEHKRSIETLTRVRKWLTSVQSGIIQNNSIPINSWFQYFITELNERGPKAKLKIPESEETSSKRPKRISTYEFEPIPLKTVLDSGSPAYLCFQQFSYYCIHKFFERNLEIGTVDSEWIQELVPHVQNGLNSNSRDVSLISHRIIQHWFLWNSELQAFLEPSTKSIWIKLITNLNQYTFTAHENLDHEMVNIIFLCITTFLTTHPEWKLRETDFSVLLNCTKALLTNGNCSSSALKFLDGIFTKKFTSPELESLMSSVLKESVRSTSEHIITGCRKAFVKFTLLYQTDKDKVQTLITNLISEFNKASLLHEQVSILELIRALIMECPKSTFADLLDPLLWFTFQKLTLPNTTLKQHCIELLKLLIGTFQSQSEEKAILEFGNKLIKASNFGYWSERILTLGQIFMKFFQNPSKESKEFLKTLSTNWLNLLQTHAHKSSRPDTSLINQILVQVQSILTAYFGRKESVGWEPNGSLEILWKDLLSQIISSSFLTHSHPWIKQSSLQICKLLLSSANWNLIVRDLKSSLELGTTNSRPRLPHFQICKTVQDLKSLLASHLTAIKFTKNSQVLDLASMNLCLLIQLLGNLGPNCESLTHSFVIQKLKKILLHEVTQDGKNFSKRKVGYKIFHSFVGLIGSHSESILKDGQELKIHSLLDRSLYWTEDLESCTLEMIRLALRDSTDSNVEDSVRAQADSLMLRLGKRWGEDLIGPIIAKIRVQLHEKRKAKKSQKAQNMVLHPGIKRKRSSAPGKSQTNGFSGSDKPKTKKRKSIQNFN